MLFIKWGICEIDAQVVGPRKSVRIKIEIENATHGVSIISYDLLIKFCWLCIIYQIQWPTIWFHLVYNVSRFSCKKKVYIFCHYTYPNTYPYCLHTPHYNTQTFPSIMILNHYHGQTCLCSKHLYLTKILIINIITLKTREGGVVYYSLLFCIKSC